MCQGFYSDCARGWTVRYIARQVEPAVDVHGNHAVESVVRIRRVAEGDYLQHRPVGNQRTLCAWLHLHPEAAPALVGGNKSQVGWAGIAASGQDGLPHVGGAIAGVNCIRNRVGKRGVAGCGGIC